MELNIIWSSERGIYWSEIDYRNAMGIYCSDDWLQERKLIRVWLQGVKSRFGHCLVIAFFHDLTKPEFAITQ